METLRYLMISELALFAGVSVGRVRYALSCGDIPQPVRLGPLGARVWTLEQAWAVKEHFQAQAARPHGPGRPPKVPKYPLPPVVYDPQV